jgi:hypothetical protein
MGPQAGRARKNLLPLLLLISLTTITTQTKADFTPPNLNTWIGSGETTGIFTAGKLAYNITSGEQQNPTFAQLRFHSNTSPIDLGICIADFRLYKVEENGSLTLTDYTHYTLSSIDTENGVFWASTIYDYPSNYRIGVVIWNATDGSVVGRLITIIHTNAPPPRSSYVSLTTDKTEYAYTEDIHVKLTNFGPPIEFGPDSGDCVVYRLVCGEWRSVTSEHVVTLVLMRMSKGGSYSWTLPRSIMDLSQPGDYRVEKSFNYELGWQDQRVFAVFRINSTPFIGPVTLFDCASGRICPIIAGALIGGLSGLIVFYIIRRKRAAMIPRDVRNSEAAALDVGHQREKPFTSSLKYMLLGSAIIILIVALGASYTLRPDDAEKIQLVTLALWDRVGYNPGIHTILVVNNSLISGVNLPPDINGRPVRLVTKSWLKAQGGNITTYHAIEFSEIKFVNFWEGEVAYHTDYGSYWSHLYNEWSQCAIKRGLCGWYIESKTGIRLD